MQYFYASGHLCRAPSGFNGYCSGRSILAVIWEEYRSIIQKHDTFRDFEYIERLAFYERTKKAYALIATCEMARYANIIFKKGIVED